MKNFILLLSLFISGCSVFGDNGVDSAPYTLIASDQESNIEIRNYESMILVSASMGEGGENSAFRKLFKYISGDNQGSREIAMTAPVFMDEEQADGTEIAMTAPVFMTENSTEPSMSFVMPADFTLATTPIPNDPDVVVSEVTDYKVAAIKFSGTLSDGNVSEHTAILRKWLQANNYQAVGEPIKAGYNGPLTIPFLRHNEVLIPIQ
ncbi:heme-binding protein [Alteromonas sp. ASW11-36]|uniref:Heme-binding protein n=1 Tax=Alteromonas arenosi TaxID=3055817 RepID=A0ABT7STT1_9ALTE|nr:heme-binding protein [Alteromonas sp. ASW11-36]MDM7859581.1 heme-binding protein [Alteromonas sp. ASW11-36]